ncbi:MAG: hypothetical protein STHCBS139747_003781 [Sporothrix thermara]
MALQRTYSSSRHSLGLYKNVITVCRYALPAGSDEAQVKASIRQALTTVVLEKLPTLRVGIEGEDTKKPVFVALPSLDLREHLEWVARTPETEDAQLIRDLERENARPWLDVATHSPWRVIVYLNTAAGWADVAFAVHHALGDGRSGVAFHSHLVQTLNSQASSSSTSLPAEVHGGDDDEKEQILSFTELPAITPPQEQLIKFTISWLFFIAILWREFAPAWLQRAPPKVQPYVGKPISLEPKLTSKLRAFHLPPDQAAALLAACRAHGVTMTGLVNGLMMVLYARRLPADVAPALSCNMPISLRPYVTKPADRPDLDVDRSMANLVASYHHTFDAAAVADGRTVAATDAEDDEKVWRAAAALGGALKAHLATATKDCDMGLMDWVSDWHEWWRKQEGKARDATWSISNTGSIPATGDAPAAAAAAAAAEGGGETLPQWKITRHFFTHSILGADALLDMTMSGVRGGDVSVTVAWHHGATEDEFAEQFVEDLQACLERLATSGHFAVPNHLSK